MLFVFKCWYVFQSKLVKQHICSRCSKCCAFR